MQSTLTRAGLGALFIVLLVTAFGSRAGGPRQATYEIQGPFCSGCVGQLTKVAKQLEGVAEVRVDVEQRLVHVTFDDAKVTAEAIMERINGETAFDLALSEVKAVEPPSKAGLFGIPCC